MPEKAAKEAVSEVGDKVAGVTKDLSEIAADALAGFVTEAARGLLPATGGGRKDKK